jgi:ChAPs (Chs5p-Arf1p-binding proteins)
MLTTTRHEATPDMWQETYVSAILRAILYSDDPTHWLEAYRKLDPITSPDSEIRFLQGAEALFMKGVFGPCLYFCITCSSNDRLAGRV